LWQVIYIATTKPEALELEEKITTAGFLVTIEPVDGGGFQIKVPQSEAQAVYEYLNDYF
jgi:hypothetical protein